MKKPNQNTATTTAYLRRLPISPRKVALVLDQVRGLSVSQALTRLEHITNRSAQAVRKLLYSTIANAVYNHQLNSDTLLITSIYVTPGRTLKRIQAHAQGRAFQIRKRSSHVTVCVQGRLVSVARRDPDQPLHVPSGIPSKTVVADGT